MTPIISIVGKSQAGKTTLIEKLIPELKSRGYRVATIKHASKSITFDKPGKDSWRHIQAGSKATIVSSPDKLVLIKHIVSTITLNEIAHLFGKDYDIILAEGFKHENTPKIEVHRKEVGLPLGHLDNLFAIATNEPLEIDTKQFSLEDTKGLVDLLEKCFIKP